MNAVSLETLVVLAISGAVVIGAVWVTFKLTAQAMKVVVPAAALLGIAAWVGIVDVPSFSDLDLPTAKEFKQKADEAMRDAGEYIESFQTEAERGDVAGVAPSGPCIADPVWDEEFSKPQYILHYYGVHTMSGFEEREYYALGSKAPSGDRCCDAAPGGKLVKADGSGGTFTYHADKVGGPFRTPRQVCQGAAGLPLEPNHTWTAGWGKHATDFRQKDCP